MRQFKNTYQFYLSSIFFALVLQGATIFFGSIASAEKTNSAPCDRLAVGSFSLLNDSNLSPDQRLILSYDKESMLKGDGINLHITNIATGDRIHFIAKAQLIFQGASDDLNQIILQSAVGDHSEFYIFDKYGSQLRNFKLSWTNGEEESINGMQFDSKANRWLIATNRRIVAYSNLQQNLTTIFEIKNQQGSVVEWFNQFDKSEPFIFVNNGKSLLIYISKVSDTGASSSTLLVFDSRTLHQVREILITSQSTPMLIDSSHLVFPLNDDNSYEIIDIISGLKRYLKNDSYGSGAKFAGKKVTDILIGADGTFGTVSGSGKIRYYNGSLGLISEVSLPGYSRWVKISMASDRKNLLLLDSDRQTTFLYNLEKREFIKLPQVLNFLLNRSGLSVFENQIFAPIFNARTNKISLFNYPIESQCVSELPIYKQPSEITSVLKNKNMTLLAVLNNSLSMSKFRTSFYSGSRFSSSDMMELKKSLKSFIDSYLTLESVSDAHNSFFRIDSLLSAFQPFYSAYSEDEKESLIDSMAVNLAERFNKKTEYSEISISKIANIFVANLKPIFGISAEPRTDFMLIKDLVRDPSGKTVRPIVLGSQPIGDENKKNTRIKEGDIEHRIGIYIKNDFAPLQLIENQPQQFSIDWEFNKQKWQATGQSEILSLRHLVNMEKTPRYEQYWADNRLVGMVLISPNLGDPKWLVRQYLSYFKDQGFSFGESKMVWSNNPSSIKDFIQGSYLFPKNATLTDNAKDWFGKMISEGSLDYLIKEAHSGGNNEVVFIGKINSILKGFRKLNNGKEEVIYIVFPAADSFSKSDQVPITNQEFGAWLRMREASPVKGQLLYVNASCWSSSKARDEIISARSPLLVEIATAYSSLTFQNSSRNHLQVLLSSIRRGLPYLDIQKNLEEVKTFDGTKNPYILPSQRLYDEKIWQGLNSALDYSVDIQKQD